MLLFPGGHFFWADLTQFNSIVAHTVRLRKQRILYWRLFLRYHGPGSGGDGGSAEKDGWAEMNMAEYLSQAYHIDVRIESKLEQLQSLKSLAENATTNFVSEPVSGTYDQHRRDNL